MKTRHYIREETDTFDEVNKVLNELRDEIVDDSVAFCRIVTELASKISKLSSRISKLEKKIKELEKPKKQSSAKKE